MIKQQVAQQIDQLLNKEMDRKDFLKHVGLAAIAITGATTILRILVNQPSAVSGTKKLADSSSKSGYGASSYGG